MSTPIQSTTAALSVRLEANAMLGDIQQAMRRIEDAAEAWPVAPGYGRAPSVSDVCLYRVSALTSDEEYPHREAFANVLSSFDAPGFSLVYILEGNERGVELYIGVTKTEDGSANALDYGKTLRGVFEGNFNGSILEQVNSEELTRLLSGTDGKFQAAGAVLGVPSVQERKPGEKYDFQGVDRLINAMLGLEWRVMVVCSREPSSSIEGMKSRTYWFYDILSAVAKQTQQISKNSGTSDSTGESWSHTHGTNYGLNESNSDSAGWSETEGNGNGDSTGKNGSKSHSYGKSSGTNDSSTTGSNRGRSTSEGSSSSMSLEVANKKAQEWMKTLDEVLLPRLDAGEAKGLFSTSVFYMARNEADADRLKSTILSLFQGGQRGNRALKAVMISMTADNRNAIMSCRPLRDANIPSPDENVRRALILLSRKHQGRQVELGTLMTANEVSIIAGLPQKEVPGIRLNEGVVFGLNEKTVKKGEGESEIELGQMVQRGRVLDVPFMLSRDCLKKHVFVAGVTGSGKTTTCHRLLLEAGVPFLVIEPAKTEYRALLKEGKFKDVVVFTVGNEQVAPFRLNPFELVKGELIGSHADMVKAAFTSAFPMEASMPQLLEEAIYECYEDKGWDVATGKNLKFGDGAYGKEGAFPTMSDMLSTLETVVESKGFDERLKSEYIGSLVSRFSNLTKGTKGLLLDAPLSTSFEYIARHNVVLELEELKSPEDKALVMGFVLCQLQAVIKRQHKELKEHTRALRHITLVEESHRLLSKSEYGDSGSKKGAVETFTDMLAEVRKYGEGLVIVDQIPNKLASEVLKNTNTKIIHRILARDDKEAVGDAMLMNDKQKRYLSALEVGHAVVFTEQTEQPVHIKVTAATDTSEKEVSDDEVKERFEKASAMRYGESLGAGHDGVKVKDAQPLFDEVADSIARPGSADRVTLDEGKKTELLAKVKEISSMEKMSLDDVWLMLIHKRELTRKKCAGNKNDAEERRRALVNFFLHDFPGLRNGGKMDYHICTKLWCGKK